MTERIDRDIDRSLTVLARQTGVASAATRIVGTGREAEHRAGRVAVIAAFDRSGLLGTEPLGRNPDGRPRWPAGWTGSVAHADSVAIAAVATTTTHLAVGIDVERAGALDVADARMVLTPSEQAVVDAAPAPAGMTTLLWSAKESAFKAWSTASAGLTDVDPLDIAIQLADDSVVRASATGRLRAAPFVRPLEGRHGSSGGLVFTILVHRAVATR